MPAPFANSRKSRLAETHLEFMAEDETDDQLFSIAFGAFATGQGRRKNIRGMRWVLLPVNVVVLHAADHQGVGQGGGNGVNVLASADDGGGPRCGDLVYDALRNRGLVVLV